ncbi:MAG: hypothetical protein NW206_04760 [Hyphomonadaceae bacterium]|nr:hypothetical protein [Hyphomonadaceae bacterium]
MTSVRIVCSYDGLDAAHTLGRVLAAEEYEVEINHGRIAQAKLAAERDAREAVVLIWSPGAGGAPYILHWRQKVAPANLVEIAICEAWPNYPRRWPVIDFSNWKGRRGSTAWRALSERLRAIARSSAPARPAPWRSAMALGAAGAMAVAGAVLVRINDTTHTIDVAEDSSVLDQQSFTGLGGPLSAMEPAGAGDADVVLGPVAPRLAPISTAQPRLLEAAELTPDFQARSTGLFGRIVDMTEPLLDRINRNDPAPPERGP